MNNIDYLLDKQLIEDIEKEIYSIKELNKRRTDQLIIGRRKLLKPIPNRIVEESLKKSNVIYPKLICSKSLVLNNPKYERHLKFKPKINPKKKEILKNYITYNLDYKKYKSSIFDKNIEVLAKKRMTINSLTKLNNSVINKENTLKTSNYKKNTLSNIEQKNKKIMLNNINIIRNAFKCTNKNIKNIINNKMGATCSSEKKGNKLIATISGQNKESDLQWLKKIENTLKKRGVNLLIPQPSEDPQLLYLKLKYINNSNGRNSTILTNGTVEIDDNIFNNIIQEIVKNEKK